MSLHALFYPQSLAVIGASTQEGSVGNEIAKNLATQGFKGKLYFVNTKPGTLFGHKLITDLKHIKAPLDLAIIAIPGKFVVEEIKQLIPLKIKAVVVISAGFKEVGNREAEVELAKICEDHEITLIGPNCLGLLNPEVKMNGSFAPLMPSMGSIAFVSQSGAICASVLDYARQRGLGFSKFVSVGNKALVGEAELLDYLYHDSKTKVIAMYVEELQEIERVRKVAMKVTHGQPHKPIVILKAGRSAAGQKAALSHTGSLGGSDQAYGALFAQTGMIRADSIDELFDFIECFARNRELRKDRVAVITNAGGPGVLTADALIADGLQLATISPETQDKLKRFLPPAASVKNPVDILGDAPAERYKLALNTLLNDPGVDAIQLVLTPQSMTQVEDTARAIVAAKRRSHKPLEITFMGQSLVEKGLDILYDNNVATASFPEAGSGALAALHQFSQWLRPRHKRPENFEHIYTSKVAKILARHKREVSRLLPMDEAFQILDAYGLPVTERWIVKTVTGAKEVAAKTKEMLALKIVSPDISHKSDVGGVVLNVHPTDLAQEYTKLINHIHKVKPAAKIDGVEIMPMVSDEGIEIILGATTDPQLGKQILVGLGGIYAEAIQDVSWGLAPLTSDDITAMIDKLKSAKILAGIRGHGPLAVEELEDCLGRLSRLVTDFPEIAEIDINPLKVLDQKKGAVVLDARIVLAVPATGK